MDFGGSSEWSVWCGLFIVLLNNSCYVMLKGTPLLSFSFLTLLLPPIISIYPISLLFLSRFSADARYWYRLSNRGVRSTMSMTWKISLRTLIRWWPVSRPSMSRDYDIMVKAALMPVCFVVCCCFFIVCFLLCCSFSVSVCTSRSDMISKRLNNTSSYFRQRTLGQSF